MDNQNSPDHVVELDLPKVMKSGMLWTFLSIVILTSLRIMIEKEVEFTITLWAVCYFILGYIVLIILHEFFHLLGFRVFSGVPWKRMVIGFDLKMGIAYATTDQMMTNAALRKALLLPFWMTGILPAIVGLYFGNGTLLMISAFLIGGAAGDFAMYRELKKIPDHFLIKDDPKLPKLYVFDPERV